MSLIYPYMLSQKLKSLQGQATMLGEALNSQIEEAISDPNTNETKLSMLQELNKIHEDAYALTCKAFLIGSATSTALGAGISKIVDTNEMPSDLKTAGSIFGAAFLSNVLTSVIFNTTTSAADLADMTRDAVQLRKNIGTLQFSAEIREAYVQFANDLLLLTLSYLAVGLVVCSTNAYHGYKRNNDSIGYGLAWFLTGYTGLGMSLVQGFAKPLPK